MLTAKTSSKGQIVIPKELRDRLGITPGTLVQLKLAKGKIEVRPLPDDPIAALRGSLRGQPSLANKLIKEHQSEVRKDAKRN